MDLVGYISPYALGSYTVASGVTMGSTYRFKIRAQNVYGWGPYSAVVQIVASDTPS